MAGKSLTKYIKNPQIIFIGLAKKGWLNWMSDKTFLKIAYRLIMKKKLNLKNPQTFNEKLQWLKLYNRKPIYTTMVDKYEVKQYVAEQIGEEHIIPTYGVWDSFDEINFDMLPDQFVLKTTHDCGGVIICKVKSKFDKNNARKKIKKSMKRNYAFAYREWPYKNVKPRILAEEYIEIPGHQTLPVYKVFNFGGEPSIIQAIQNDKTPDETIDYFDTEWNKLELRQNFANSNHPLTRPKQLEEMLALARTLSKGFLFLRTDFYLTGEAIYFSEYTFFSDSGLAKFEPDLWDQKLGEWIHLPQMRSEER